MYIITTRTPNEFLIDVIKNGSLVRVRNEKQFSVLTSDELTDGMERLSKLGLITYTKVVNTSTTSTPRRRKKKGN